MIKNYILANLKNIFKAPAKNLQYPFLVPGTGYTNELWGWDSYWEGLSLVKAFESFGEAEMERAGISGKTAEEHICGSALDFLNAQEEDGFTPVMVSGEGLFEGFFHARHEKGVPLNQHLPFLCQSVLNASEFVGNFGWFNRDCFSGRTIS